MSATLRASMSHTDSARAAVRDYPAPRACVAGVAIGRVPTDRGPARSRNWFWTSSSTRCTLNGRRAVSGISACPSSTRADSESTYRGVESHCVAAAALYTQQRNPPPVATRPLSRQFRVEVEGASQFILGGTRRIQVREAEAHVLLQPTVIRAERGRNRRAVVEPRIGRNGHALEQVAAIQRERLLV